MRIGIATKVFIAFAGVTLIFSAVLMFGVYRTTLLHERLRALNHRIVPLSLQLSDIQNDLKSFHIVLNEVDPVVLRRSMQLTRLLNALPDDIHLLLEDAAAVADLRDLDTVSTAEVEAFRSIHEELLELQRRGTLFAERTAELSELVLGEGPADELDAERIRSLQDELREEARQLDTGLSLVRNDIQAALDEALVRADDTERTSVYALGVLSLLALITALAIMGLVLLTLRPLTTLTEASKRIGEGDYRPIETRRRRFSSQDEITLLTREFNAMAARLSERDARLRSQHEALLQSERLATIGRMTSVITHELRNPLSSINLNAEMLMESLEDRGVDPSDPDILPLLQTIIEEVDHLKDITEEYLVYARLPTPRLEEEQVDDILQGLVDFHIWEWKQKVEIDLDLPDEPIEVLADPNQLRRAFLNILKNAVEASPEGGKVEVVARTDRSSCHVEITDHGDGLDAETQARLFEPFFTTKSSGTGLGLPMTQQVLEQHGGRLEVESTPGEYTTFRVTLPLRQTGGQETTEVTDNGNLAGGSSALLG